ncbi:hypothetical protein COU54_04040 [Candidatus Pacearchaeota archaeon CG10_big_fil_rev_8_21_14_0_10_31_24]|nr:MAG: hypothetical protein COU54_04040 [Candidatus Pacearchaeota archaeon CG10_big_fil_rev_8_21_14_0_10_31_24]
MIFRREIGAKGQVVIPKDIRTILGVTGKDEIIFEVKDKEVTIKNKQTPEDFLKEFFKYKNTGNRISLKELKKLEEESYDLH